MKDDFVVVSNGTLDARKAHEQQRPAPPLTGGHPTKRNRVAYQPTIRALMEDQPARWWTYATLMAASHFQERVVRDVVRRLIAAGWVESEPLPRDTAGGNFRQLRWRGQP
jgi:hypothetical protein